MEYVRLGDSGLRVSRLCLGALMFGGQASARTGASMMALARERGVNFVDTAEGYGRGKSERALGRLIRRDRHDWVVATKVGSASSVRPGVNTASLSRKWMMEAIDGSLTRLGTDYVDVYYLHQDDPATPLEETLAVLADIIRAGKVRFWGFSNYPAWRIGLMIKICADLNMPRPVVCQPYYNAMNRQSEVDILPACRHLGIGVVPYSPLARGVLTGKYGPGAPPGEGTRAARGDRRMMQVEFRRESLSMAQEIKVRARARGMTAGQFALLWVLNNRAVTAALPGPRTVAQWRENLDALDHVFTARDEAFLDALVPAGQPSTPGFQDPKFPVAGRFPATD